MTWDVTENKTELQLFWSKPVECVGRPMLEEVLEATALIFVEAAREGERVRECVRECDKELERVWARVRA